jgi:hypothetical protein
VGERRAGNKIMDMYKLFCIKITVMGNEGNDVGAVETLILMVMENLTKNIRFLYQQKVIVLWI